MFCAINRNYFLLNSDDGDTDPERLFCDEGEIWYWPLLLTPVIRNTGVSQNLPVFESYTHIQSNVFTAARQTDVETVRERSRTFNIDNEATKTTVYKRSHTQENVNDIV